MSRPLQFTPGARARYSNFGFCVLGRIIERITNMPYEVYVRDHVLAPMDIHAMSIGYERMSERGPFEPKYYAFDGERKVQSVLPGEGLVAGPYGGHDLAAIDSTGGWIASAIDLARVLMAVENVVSADSYAEMIAGPHIPDDYGSESHWEGLGVVVGPISTTWSKSGGLSGTQSLVVHDDRRGYSWVYLANSRPERSNDFQQAMIGAIQRGLEAHASAGVGDSAVDLFPQYPSPFLPARHR